MKEEIKKIIRKLIWDYNISEVEFFEILNDKKQIECFDSKWALKRAIEGLNYYDLMKLVGIKMLVNNWDALRNKIKSASIKKGIDYVIRKYIISTTR